MPAYYKFLQQNVFKKQKTSQNSPIFAIANRWLNLQSF
ncbi:hypothetical protein EVA_17573 [gut metagenome]|uniref:Uncharacterized protein n=1 Tax=gut metagenome TaxID=749906 RepID=J9FIQ5_9ZZZZ